MGGVPLAGLSWFQRIRGSTPESPFTHHYIIKSILSGVQCVALTHITNGLANFLNKTEDIVLKNVNCKIKFQYNYRNHYG